MRYLLKKAIIFLITFFIFLITILIYTLLLYNQKIDATTASIYRTTFIIGTVIFFIYGLLTGLIERKKGFISSFISTIILILLIILVKVIAQKSFAITNLIKYGVYLLASSIGGILGVNFTSKKMSKSPLK